MQDVIARVSALSLSVVLALPACSASDTTEEPAPATLDRPAYADEEGPSGAEAFAGYWIDTLNEATTSGETERFRSLSTDACVTCSDFADQLDGIYSSGGRVESDGWDVGSVVLEAGASDEMVGMLVTVDVSAQRVFDSADAKAQRYEGGTQAFRFEIIRRDDDWFVDDLSAR